ncbi:MAG: 1,4-alpha-glucan branching protein GlgB [Verrucomicrobia bacterium]|nr:1,4-alpha-glucan branching protein GlgB [Verrucomicrobiota bacterium]
MDPLEPINSSPDSSPREESFDLFNQGIDSDLAEKLGAHQIQVNGLQATRFRVWAPAAKQVAVIGDFNDWNRTADPLFPVAQSGIWTTIVMNLSPGTRYQYCVLDQENQWTAKSDPFGKAFARLPDHSSLVTAPLEFKWHDELWLDRRQSTDWLREPISIYELHLGSWMITSEPAEDVPLYRNIAEPLIDYLCRLEFTHVLFMPLMEHPFGGSWGYQVTGFYAPTSRYGSPDDLAYLVDQLHRHGIGVIFDWVPAHFPKDPFGLNRFDGSPLFEYACPKQGQHPDWGTAIFDYNKPQVVSFLISSALAWIRDFHFDGIRVDAVASMIYRDYSRPSGDWTPNVDGGHENLEAVRFLQSLNQHIGDRHPGVIRIAEESTAWPGVTRSQDQGGLGFDFKWNLGWMHDTLAYFSQPEEKRQQVHTQFTLPSLYQHTENYCLPFSHDEVVHEKKSMLNKMPGATLEVKARHLRALYAWMWAWPGKKLLFMGAEFGQLNEWDHNDFIGWNRIKDGLQQGLQQLVARLNRGYRNHPSLSDTDHKASTFHWLVADDTEHGVFAFARISQQPQHTIVSIGNFSSRSHEAYRIGIPTAGEWLVSMNSSWTTFQGDQSPASQKFQSEALPARAQPHSLSINLPDRTTLHLRPVVDLERA